MNSLKLAMAAAMMAGGAMLAPANAAPVTAPSGVSRDVDDQAIVLAQFQRRNNFGAGARVGGPRVGGPRVGGPRVVGRGVVVRRGGRGIGPGGAAVIGLGVLGAAAIAAGAANAAPRECFIQQQEIFDRWGNFRGYRNVRVCE